MRIAAVAARAAAALLLPGEPLGVGVVLVALVVAAGGTALGGLLVVPFGVLFWSADAAFAELLGRLPVPSLEVCPAASSCSWSSCSRRSGWRSRRAGR
jgi:hypothetical protein